MTRPRIGDTRIIAESLTDLPYDEDGEMIPDAATYEEYGPFDTMEEAASVAQEHDLNGEGLVLIQRYGKPLGWDEDERYCSHNLKRNLNA